MKLQLLGLKDLNIVQIRIVNTDEDFESLPIVAKNIWTVLFLVFLDIVLNSVNRISNMLPKIYSRKIRL